MTDKTNTNAPPVGFLPLMAQPIEQMRYDGIDDDDYRIHWWEEIDQDGEGNENYVSVECPHPGIWELYEHNKIWGWVPAARHPKPKLYIHSIETVQE